jgi:hypothetical protein
VEDPGQRIDPVSPTWCTAPIVPSSNGANPLPKFVADGRISPPASRDALLGSASAMASTGLHGPTVVDRIHDDLASSLRRDTVLAPKTFEADVSSGVPLEHLHDPTDGLRIEPSRAVAFSRGTTAG